MSTRISLTITNGTKEKVQCKHILCQDIDGMDVGDTLETGATKHTQLAQTTVFFATG